MALTLSPETTRAAFAALEHDGWVVAVNETNPAHPVGTLFICWSSELDDPPIPEGFTRIKPQRFNMEGV